MNNKKFLTSTFAILFLLLSACGDKGTGALDDPSAEQAEIETAITASEKNYFA